MIFSPGHGGINTRACHRSSLVSLTTVGEAPIQSAFPLILIQTIKQLNLNVILSERVQAWNTVSCMIYFIVNEQKSKSMTDSRCLGLRSGHGNRKRTAKRCKESLGGNGNVSQMISWRHLYNIKSLIKSIKLYI